MRILGVDPGTRITGWGHVVYEGGQFVSFQSGTIRPSKANSMAQKLGHLEAELEAVIGETGAAIVAMEAGFAGKYAKAVMVTAYARSAVMIATYRRGRAFVEYAPAAVKRATSMSGRSDKAEVNRMVGMILRTPGAEFQQDEADALSVAICHANRMDEAGIVGAGHE